MQHAVENIRRDPPRARPGTSDGMAKRCEDMEREHLAGSDSDQRFQLMPS